MARFLPFAILVGLVAPTPADEPADLPKACIDGTGPAGSGLERPTSRTSTAILAPGPGTVEAHCTGNPVGVIRSQKQYTNFELVARWRHLESGGNSGIFVWAPPEGLEGLQSNQLPEAGIEVQILDHGFAEKYEQRTGKKGDWFTTDGDVFPVGNATMTPFPPASPNGSRSFPRKNLSKGAGEWNHYYVRCVNGEVRLWVNGEEVSGGTGCKPATGYLCLESEGAPVEFRDLRIRELP